PKRLYPRRRNRLIPVHPAPMRVNATTAKGSPKGRNQSNLPSVASRQPKSPTVSTNQEDTQTRGRRCQTNTEATNPKAAAKETNGNRDQVIAPVVNRSAAVTASAAVAKTAARLRKALARRSPEEA